MLQKASLRSISALETWFVTGNRPFWTIWTGFSKDNKDRAMMNSTIDNMEESWNLLHQIVKDKTEGGGRITVFASDQKGSSHGFTEYLEIAADAATSSIQGAGQMGIYGGVDNYIQSRMNDFLKDREIETLRAQLQEKEEGSGINKLFNRIMDEAPIQEIIMGIIAKYMGVPIAAPAPVNGPRIITDSEQELLSVEDTERIEKALGRIAVHFPDIPGVLEKLATFIESNPVMAKSLLKNI